MLIRHLVTAFLATISLFFSYQATKTLIRYIFDEVFDTATNFDYCNFDNSNFEPTPGFDLYEDILNAFDSVQSEPVEIIPNAANLFGDSPTSSSDFAPPPSSSSDAPGESPSSDSPSQPLASAKSTPGHSGSTLGIRKISFYIIMTTMVLRSCWFERRPLPPPPPPPPLPPPLRPPPSPPPLPPSPPSPPSLPPPPASAPPDPSATSSPASAVNERLALVAAPARQAAGARRKSRRLKKRG